MDYIQLHLEQDYTAQIIMLIGVSIFGLGTWCLMKLKKEGLGLAIEKLGGTVILVSFGYLFFTDFTAFLLICSYFWVSVTRGQLNGIS